MRTMSVEASTLYCAYLTRGPPLAFRLFSLLHLRTPEPLCHGNTLPEPLSFSVPLPHQYQHRERGEAVVLGDQQGRYMDVWNRLGTMCAPSWPAHSSDTRFSCMLAVSSPELVSSLKSALLCVVFGQGYDCVRACRCCCVLVPVAVTVCWCGSCGRVLVLVAVAECLCGRCGHGGTFGCGLLM